MKRQALIIWKQQIKYRLQQFSTRKDSKTKTPCEKKKKKKKKKKRMRKDEQTKPATR